METLEKMPFEAQHKIFKRLAEIADSKSLPKEEQEKYDNSKKIALNLLAYNTPIDIIAKSTDLSIEEIKKNETIILYEQEGVS